ncbi:MAG: ABC-type transport auxiliary lipoprotein family protein [Gammaproteobacteria bacterium]
MTSRVLILLLLLSGCSFSGKRASVTLHDLGPAVVAHQAEASYSSVITVSAPEWLNRNRLYYRQLFSSPTALKTYSKDRWIASPGELLERRFGLIRPVQGLRLKIELVDFEQQFEAPGRARSLFSFKVEVFRRGGRKPLGKRFFSFQQQNETADAAGAIKAFAELSDQAAGELEDWLEILNRPNHK